MQDAELEVACALRGRHSTPLGVDAREPQEAALHGAEVRAFTTLAFVHAKFTLADTGTSKAKTAVSSVNWSKSSYAKNREAGAVLSGSGAAARARRRAMLRNMHCVLVPSRSCCDMLQCSALCVLVQRHAQTTLLSLLG